MELVLSPDNSVGFEEQVLRMRLLHRFFFFFLKITLKCTFHRLLSTVAFWRLFCGRDLEEHRNYQFLVKLDGGKSAMSPWGDSCVGRISSQAGNALLCLLSWLSEVWELKPHELTLDSELPPSSGDLGPGGVRQGHARPDSLLLRVRHRQLSLQLSSWAGSSFCMVPDSRCSSQVL